MRSRKKREPKPPSDHALAAELTAILESVGPRRYASATAEHFAPGGRYNPRKKQRYALM